MKIGEATRQFQAGMEAERQARYAYGEVCSMQDILSSAAEEVDDMEKQMVIAWCNHVGRA